MSLDSSVRELPQLLLRLWDHLSGRRQRQFIALLCLMLTSALAEVVSLGAVLPFLSTLIAPETVFNHPLVSSRLQALGIDSPAQLALPLTIAFAASALIAGAIRILLLWASTKLSYASGADLSIELYRRTLYQPYPVHLARNSSEVISSIISKVNGLAFGVLVQLLTLASSIVLLITVMIALIAIDPGIALSATAVFGFSYGVITWLSRRRLRHNSERIAHDQTQVVKALQEGLGGIRDVLLDGSQPFYCEIYRRADLPLRSAQGNNVFISNSPRFAMEALGMTLIAIFAYALTRHEGAVATALPLLGALALGAQRLLPALQQCYGSWTNMLGTQASLADVLELLDQPLPQDILSAAPSTLVFSENVRFDKVRFKYSPDGPWVLDGLDLTILKGSRVGFVGSTGSGKSTALDLLMGLLVPTEGRLFVDGQPVCGELTRAWQRTIAHVPQTIYLADATIAENIAFGVPFEAIDLDRVREAAAQAQIASFIESRPERYAAFVGERGIRLSGGQRQRIGIARALYKRASVLIFDEATSALDNVTEQSIMETIGALNRDLTVLIVAHRLTTVRHCDTIVELAGGRVAAQGTFAELLERSPTFRHMAMQL